MIALAGCFLFDSKENALFFPPIKYTAGYWLEETPIPTLNKVYFSVFL